MEGQFIVYGDSVLSSQSGIGKKIMSQVKVFNKSGLNCKIRILPSGVEKYGKPGYIFFRFVPGANVFPMWQGEEEFAKLDYLYFRRPIAMTIAMRKFLKKVKEKNPNIKIVMEVPTYPYDKELHTVTMMPFLYKDRFNRKKMKGLIDAIVVVGDDNSIDEIWGIPAVPFRNGYDVESVKVAEKSSDNSCINLCCVAMFAPWHGYERLLLGMEKYYENGGTREIRCHMIGEGRECNYYKKIAKNPYLKDRVIFYGRRSGDELEALYNMMDIGVCSLGVYKIINTVDGASVLKSREYMAKGLPMITGCRIDVFAGKNIDFVCEFENNDSILDMNKVIEFYDKVAQRENLRADIRQFALETIDLSNTMEPVVELIKNL